MRRKLNESGQEMLTAKETILIACATCFGDGANSAILAGYSPRSAKQLASRTLRKPIIQATIRDIKERLATAA